MNAKEKMLQMIGNNNVKSAEVFEGSELLVRLSEDHSKQNKEIFFDILSGYQDDDIYLSSTVTLSSGDWIETRYMEDFLGEPYLDWSYNRVPKRIFINSVYSVSFSTMECLKKVEVFSTLAMANSYIGMLIREKNLIGQVISGSKEYVDEHHRFNGGEVIILTEHKI
jgi:hypothetical protein